MKNVFDPKINFSFFDKNFLSKTQKLREEINKKIFWISNWEMQTFWSHLTFANFRQPFRTCFAAWTWWTTTTWHYHLSKARTLTLLKFGLKKFNKNLGRSPLGNWLTLQKLKTQTNQVVTRLSGDGAVEVLCMLRINFDRPNFHSISDCACWKFLVISLLFKEFPLKF